MQTEQIMTPYLPAIPGLRFRPFRGERDFPKMLAVVAASVEADHLERVSTLEDMEASYAHLINCDPYRDMILAEVDGQVVGYARGWWEDEPEEGLIFASFGYLAPAWRRVGIGAALLAWMERRQRQIAAEHPPERPRFFQIWASQFQVGLAALLEGAGYQPVRYFHRMVRTSLEKIREAPLPDGLEVRPALPEHYPAILEALDEIFRDHWGYSEFTEEHFKAWQQHDRFFQPKLWQVAWDVAADQVAGHVLTYIDPIENEKFDRRRGYTETIGVRRAWRRRGLATALIMRSLQVQKDSGMTESALGVDSQNLSGATRLYERCGFEVERRSTVYRKPF